MGNHLDNSERLREAFSEVLDRGEKTKEELERDVPEATRKLIDDMAEKVAKDAKKAKRAKQAFYGKRNRRAWIRMNRPARTESVDRGHAKIFALLKRGFGILAYHRYVLRHKQNLANDFDLLRDDPRYQEAVRLESKKLQEWIDQDILNRIQSGELAI